MVVRDPLTDLITHVTNVGCNKCGKSVDVTGLPLFTHAVCPHCGNPKIVVPGLLGGFVLIREMGKGAMGAVYQGFDQTLKRHVAIKVMLASYQQDSHFVENFLREAQALASLNHVNVVQIYTCGQEKGQPYIVMELIDGHRLDELMEKHGMMDELKCLEIAMDVARGLKAAQEIGLIHGDIKPQNILMDRRSTAKVVDFGLARQSKTDTGTKEIWGTPYYIAPETARRQKEDHRADIYSLGATLFHALAGAPPFDGSSAKDVVLARLDRPPPHLQSIREDIHDETDALIMRMLEMDPFKRYPTYDSLMADMTKALDAVRRGPRVIPPPPKSKTGLVIGLATAAVALVVGLGAYFVLRPKPEPLPPTATVVRVIDGQALRLNVLEETLASDPFAGNATVFTTKFGRGADAGIYGASPTSNYGANPQLPVLAQREAKTSWKTFVAFDLQPINVFKVTDFALDLTFSRAVTNAAGPHFLNLWGVADDRSRSLWKEGSGGTNNSLVGAITWNNAMGNDPANPSRMKSPATLLAKIELPAEVKAGDTFRVSVTNEVKEGALIKYLQDELDKVFVLVLTAEVTVGQNMPWSFASKENTDFAPPTLTLLLRP